MYMTLLNHILLLTSLQFFFVDSSNIISYNTQNNNTCPKPYLPLPNSYSLTDYKNSREQCTQACNNEGYCCTLGSGGCGNVPCTEGCHIAWFSEDLAACKLECTRANNAPDCSYTWNHDKIAGAGFNPFWEFGVGVPKCWGSSSCGCPTSDSWGSSNDCGSSACEAGCELAHSQSLRELFFHGENVNVDNQVGGDPIALLSTMNILSDHILNISVLNETQIQQTMIDFNKRSALLDTEFYLMEAVLDLVDDYEAMFGALFLNEKSRNGIPKQNTNNDGLDLERAMLQIQQVILDEIYHATLPETVYQNRLFPSVISECASFLQGRKWQTANYFPGYVDPPSNTSITHNITIYATNAEPWGRPVCFDQDPKIRTTGLYLPPGEIATVTVPDSFIDNQYTIRVGAASVDLQKKGHDYVRMDRVSCNYDINNSTISIASPLGGGIYIMVPFLANEGAVSVQITGGVVLAPTYSNTSLYTTSEQEWDWLRAAPAPWADFQTDNFLMNIPREWMYNYNYIHVQQLIQDYHDSMNAVLEITGYPLDKRDHVLYVQADVTIRHGAFGVGYPQVNNLISSGPDGPTAEGHFSSPGLSTHWLIAEGPFSDKSGICFHELGHCQLISLYRGENEAIVNFFHVYVRNVKDNVDLDLAFSDSLVSDGNWTIDNAAIHWMITENFRQGNDMDHSNGVRDEFKYQHRGYAKYADIVRLFGWQVLRDFFHQEHLHYRIYENNDSIEGLEASDDRTLRLSMAAGFDLTPLIHFWGIKPINESALKSKIQEKKIPQSEAVFDLINRYASIIPMSNTEFLSHFEEVHPGRVGDSSCSNENFGCGYYNAWSDVYNITHGEAGVNAIGELLNMYPTQSFTRYPTISPTSYPSLVPSNVPTISLSPSRYPSLKPSSFPSTYPSTHPSLIPSLIPSQYPTRYPSLIPSLFSSTYPSTHPSLIPSTIPSQYPTRYPSTHPSLIPSTIPSPYPTRYSSISPSSSFIPSIYPSHTASLYPTLLPSSYISSPPSIPPSIQPSIIPSSFVPSLPPNSSMPPTAPSRFINDSLCKKTEGVEFLQNFFPRIYSILYPVVPVKDSPEATSLPIIPESNDQTNANVQSDSISLLGDNDQFHKSLDINPAKLIASIKCKRNHEYFKELVEQGYDSFRKVDEL